MGAPNCSTISYSTNVFWSCNTNIYHLSSKVIMAGVWYWCSMGKQLMNCCLQYAQSCYTEPFCHDSNKIGSCDDHNVTVIASRSRDNMLVSVVASNDISMEDIFSHSLANGTYACISTLHYDKQATLCEHICSWLFILEENVPRRSYLTGAKPIDWGESATTVSEQCTASNCSQIASTDDVDQCIS